MSGDPFSGNEVLAPCIYRLQTISPCHAGKAIDPRPDCVLQCVLVFPLLLLNEEDYHRPSLPIHQRSGRMSQRVLSLHIVKIRKRRGRWFTTESAITVPLLTGLLPYNGSHVIA